MQVFTLLVCLTLHVFTYKTLKVTCSGTQISTVNNFMLTEELRREILIKSCCHKNEKLVQNGTNFYCISMSDDEFRINYVNFNNETDVGIPDCTTKSDVAWKCVDMLRKRSVELLCALSTNDYKVVTRLMHRSHHVLRKCCGVDQIYDVKEKKCVSNDVSQELVQQHFTRIQRKHYSFISNASFTMCSPDKVVVERKHKISDTEFPYEMNAGEFYYDFCLDLAFDSNDTKDLHWITQSCNPKKICDSIPCIRKCCMVGEVFAIVNNTSKCVPFQGSINSEFHQVERWSQADQKIQKVDVEGNTARFLN